MQIVQETKPQTSIFHKLTESTNKATKAIKQVGKAFSKSQPKKSERPHGKEGKIIPLKVLTAWGYVCCKCGGPNHNYDDKYKGKFTCQFCLGNRKRL